MMNKALVLILLLVLAGIANASSYNIRFSITANNDWRGSVCENCVYLTDGSSFFSLAGRAAVTSLNGNTMGIIQSSDDTIVLCASRDYNKFISRMPELRLRGFFSLAINFAAKPAATEIMFYVAGLVADVSQYNKIDVLVRKYGENVTMKDMINR